MGTVRQRRKPKGTNGTATPNNSTASKKKLEPSQAPDQQPPPESPWSAVYHHWSFPLYVITALIMIPYGLYLSYFYLQLQRPDWIATATFGLIKPRPAVAVTDPRQVLIVGTMSSGTSQVAADLKHTLGLEIGHESSEANWNFVRDGTVSWFHGTRFLPAPTDPRPLAQLCGNFTDSMGFHPRMYRDTSGCSVRETWSSCWMHECVKLLSSEWGCAWRDNSCQTPFRTVLHQVRHPVRTVESLVTKFCVDGVDGTLHPAFSTFAGALFAEYDFSELNCIEAATYYTLFYNQAMMEAQSNGLIDGRYRIEEASPCAVARMAGFWDDDAVYPPHKERLDKLCSLDSTSPATRPMTSKAYTVNQGQLRLTKSDLETKVNATTVQRLSELVEYLGYSFD